MFCFKRRALYFARCFHVFERLDVHPGQMPVLFEVHRSGRLYQRELCRNLCLRPSTMTVTLRRMEKAGLIERRQDSPGSAAVPDIPHAERGEDSRGAPPGAS